MISFRSHIKITSNIALQGSQFLIFENVEIGMYNLHRIITQFYIILQRCKLIRVNNEKATAGGYFTRNLVNMWRWSKLISTKLYENWQLSTGQAYIRFKYPSKDRGKFEIWNEKKMSFSWSVISLIVVFKSCMKWDCILSRNDTHHVLLNDTVHFCKYYESLRLWCTIYHSFLSYSSVYT